MIAIRVADQRKWLQHPTQNSIFLGFGATDTRVFRWQHFSEQPRLCFQDDRPQLSSHKMLGPRGDQTFDLAQLSPGTNARHASNFVVCRAMLMQDGRYVLVQTKGNPGQGRIVKGVLIFDISYFVLDEEEDAESILLRYVYIQPDILSRI